MLPSFPTNYFILFLLSIKGITATLEYGTILAYLDSSLLLFSKFQNHWAPMSNFLKDHWQGSPEMQKQK